MIGNFKIDTITETDLINLGFFVYIQKWEDIPESSLFTSNLTGKRYLKSQGNSFRCEILITGLSNSQVANYISYNGIEIDFKKDADDTIIYKCNCITEPQRFEGKPFYNAVLFRIETIQSQHETADRMATINPISTIDEDEQEYTLSFIDESGNEGLLKY